MSKSSPRCKMGNSSIVPHCHPCPMTKGLALGVWGAKKANLIARLILTTK